MFDVSLGDNKIFYRYLKLTLEQKTGAQTVNKVSTKQFQAMFFKKKKDENMTFFKKGHFFLTKFPTFTTFHIILSKNIHFFKTVHVFKSILSQFVAILSKI